MRSRKKYYFRRNVEQNAFVREYDRTEYYFQRFICNSHTSDAASLYLRYKLIPPREKHRSTENTRLWVKFQINI
jgi:hypothetical protein